MKNKTDAHRWGGRRVLNKKKFVRIDEVFDELCSVTGMRAPRILVREQKTKRRKKIGGGGAANFENFHFALKTLKLT